MEITKEMLKKFEKYGIAELSEDGREVNDPRPMVIHTGLVKPLTLSEQVKRLMKVELSHQALDYGKETEEEANDFDVEDENLITSNYDLMEEEYVAAPISPNADTTTTVESLQEVETTTADTEETKET